MFVFGIVRKMLFDIVIWEGVEFMLLDEKNKDLYYNIKLNIVGGFFIIYYWKVVKGEIKIRDGKLC